jgi:hypothetical protein
MKRFKSTMRKGFHMTFANGLTASVQWGAGNYCDNHFPEDPEDFYCRKDAQSDTAEVAVFYKGELIHLGQFLPEDAYYDEVVCGWRSPEEVLDFLNKVREFVPESEV